MPTMETIAAPNSPRLRGAHAHRDRCRGAELVEFAIVLPVLLLLLGVVSEGAGLIRTHQVLLNAAREGVRLAVVPGELGLTGDIQQRVVQYGAANGVTLTPAQVTVTQSLLIPQSGGSCSLLAPCLSASRVTVQMNYPLAFLSQLPFGVAATVPLGAAVEMENFY